MLAAIVASSFDAIIGKNLAGTVLSWNRAAEEIFGYAADEMIGQSVRRLIPSDRQAEEDRILAAIRAGERVPTFETVRLRKDGSEVQLAVTVSPVHDSAGAVVGASKIARDITGQKRLAAELREREVQFRMLAENIAQLAWIADATGWIYWYNQRWFDFTGTTPEEMAGWGWSKVHHPDYIEPVSTRWREHLAKGETWEDTFPLRGADGEYRWFLSRARPSRDESGAITHWFGTNTDVTEMRDAEKRIELLLMEVNHRSKNMLAVVQSIARQTATQGGDFLPRLEQRIQGLAANQDLLVRGSWADVAISDLVEAQLRFVGEESRTRIAVDGPRLALSPSASETIGMALHEMATNALKYGSLSDGCGTIRIGWGLVPGIEGGSDFRMEWCEAGGPPVRQPTRKGFGSQVIAAVPRGKLGGTVEMDFAPDGFRWALQCPAARVLGGGSGPD